MADWNVNWMSPSLVEIAEMRAVCARFQKSSERVVVIDDFMKQSVVDRIRPLLEGEGYLTDVFQLYGASNWTSAADFQRAPHCDQFIFEQIYAHPNRGYENSAATIQDALLRHKLRSVSFTSWLSSITGVRVTRVGTINLKRLDRRHFLKWHDDAKPKRRLCLVHYLHRDWQPHFGGRFLVRDGNGALEAIDPLFNRLIIFSATRSVIHSIEPMADAAGDWARMNYSLWAYDE